MVLCHACLEGLPLPHRQVVRIADQCDRPVEHQCLKEILAFRDHDAQVPRPGGVAHGVALASLDSRVSNGASLDTCRVEGVAVNQPPRGLRERERLQLGTGSGGEVLMSVRHISDELHKARGAPACGMQSGHLQERCFAVHQIEAVPVSVEVLHNLLRETTCPPPLGPQILTLVTVPGCVQPHGSQDYGLKQAQYGNVLSRHLPRQATQVRCRVEKVTQRDLTHFSGKSPHLDPRLVDQIERGINHC